MRLKILTPHKAAQVGVRVLTMSCGTVPEQQDMV